MLLDAIGWGFGLFIGVTGGIVIFTAFCAIVGAIIDLCRGRG